MPRSGTMGPAIRLANLVDVSVWLPLNEFAIWQIGSTFVEERFPGEGDENAPGPAVTGVVVHFRGNVVDGGIELHIPAMQCVELRYCKGTLPISKSTDRPPEVDLWIAEAGTRAAALVEIRSGGSLRIVSIKLTADAGPAAPDR